MRQIFILGFICLAGLSCKTKTEYAKFKFTVFKDTLCSPEQFKADDTFDTSKKCMNYSYVDGKGITIKGSNGNFRCYGDGVVFDQYPFDENCNPQAKLMIKDHRIPAGKCQEAKSHEGPVSEIVTDYVYPGNENCQIAAKK